MSHDLPDVAPELLPDIDMVRLFAAPTATHAPRKFDEAGRMRPSPLYDRIVDVIEELMKFTLHTRDRATYLVDRYSERKESVQALMGRMNLTAAT